MLVTSISWGEHGGIIATNHREKKMTSKLNGGIGDGKTFCQQASPATNEYELKVWLEKQGFAIESIQMILDEGGTSRGFAFAEISDGQLNEAVTTLNGARRCGLWSFSNP